MKITTTAQKNRHPLAKKIPTGLWEDRNCFDGLVDEETLEVGKKHFDEINRNDLPKHNGQALILLMLCYPDVPFSQYARLHLTLENQELFKISSCMGRLDVLMDIKSQAPNELMAMVKADGYFSFIQACSNGHLNIAQWLKENVPFEDFIAMLRKDYYSSFREACSNGHLGIAKWLKENAPDEFMAMVKAGGFYAFYWACTKGHLIIAKWLKDNVPHDQFLAMMKENNYAALRGACANGHLDTAKWLKEHTPDDDFMVMVREYNYAAFNWACANGQLGTAKWLKEIVPNDEFMTMVTAEDGGLQGACENGHIEIVQWLKENMPPDEFMGMLKANNYLAFRRACFNGHLNSVKWLKENTPDDEFVAMMRANNYCAFGWACSKNHLDIAKWLKENAPNEFLAMVEADNYHAFQSACLNGHLDAAKWLKENAPDQFMAMVKADNYYAFKSACENGHLDLVTWLKHNVPSDEFMAMVKAGNFNGFRRACTKGHLDTAKWLLQDVACFAYAEAHVEEYSGLVKPYIEHALSELRLESETFQIQNANGVFNLTDPTRSQFCFYLLRNLIRRNDRTLDDEIRFLLAIPAVKALAHQSGNELLRLAMSVGNREAITLLMNLDAVRTLAEQNNYYRDEARHGVDLRQLAQDRESSMTALTQGEAQRLKAAIDLYQPMIKTTGIKLLLQALKDHLVSEYENQPATITTDDHQIIRLPMAYKDFLALSLKGEDEQRALKAYYQNPAHTAWRYLSKPNPWMHPEASYVHVSEDGTERWSTFEEYLPLIVMLYLAVIDTANPPSEDHTFASRLSHFINELALIGRAHNWDKKRLNSKGDLEEYDDLEGDRPSCFSGVKRRLFQSVISHPLISILTPETIRNEIRLFAFEHFKSILEKEDSLALRKIFDDVMVALDDTNVAELAFFNIPEDMQQSFKEALDKKYGEQFSTNAALVTQVKQAFHLEPNATASHKRYHVLSTKLHSPSDFYAYLEKTTPEKENVEPPKLPPVKVSNANKGAGFFYDKTTSSPTRPKEDLPDEGEVLENPKAP